MPPISLATHGNTSILGQYVTASDNPDARINKRKRAMSHITPKTATNLPDPADSGAMKRARDMNGHPIALELTGQGDTEEDEEVAHVAKVNNKRVRAVGQDNKGKQRDFGEFNVQRRDQSSLQADRDHTESLLALDHDDFNIDGDTESVDDWFGDQHTVDLSKKNPSKISQVMMMERPIWSGPGTSSTLSSVGSSSLSQGVTGYPLTQGVVGPSSTLSIGDPTPLVPSATGLASTWSFSQASSTDLPSAPPSTPTTIGSSSQDIPATSTRAYNMNSKLTMATEDEADLLLPPGSNKLTLHAQHPLVHVVIQDSFDHLRACLMFTNAFPDGSLASEFIKDALVFSALDHAPGARYIYQRLLYDGDYIPKIIPLSRTRISLYRSEVKERCCAIISATMSAIGNPREIVEIVKKQLYNYTYTCPRAPGILLSQGLIMRSQLYRSKDLITVLQDMFFNGGSASFAARHDALFPKHHAGTSVTREMPMAMVSIVATGLYAAFHEWRTGEPKHINFSANSFTDVYMGHINTLKHIRDSKEPSYHQMMSSIYTLASAYVPRTVGTEIAQINLDDLE